MLKPPVFVRGGRRILVPAQFRSPNPAGAQLAGVLYSDDDGFTWKRSSLVYAPPHRAGGVHKSARWQVGACEPTVVELKDGRIWMLIRTSQDNLYEAFSSDGGETWSEGQPSRFYSTLTMPTLGRLSDGRLVLLWSNTTPLPEVERPEMLRFFLGSGVMDGTWEDVFNNRDAIHAAVSADEGRNWSGFRELYLNPRRNDSNYAETGGTDRSVHQSQFVELEDGTVLVALGQHRLHRSFIKFHPDWLDEKTRSSRFENNLEDWSHHMYIAGIRGHCAFNRKPGADLIDHPDQPGRRVLRVRRIEDGSLVSERQGAVWNFPAGYAGTLSVRLMLPKGGQGGRISLLDRWVNPTDLVADTYAMFNLDIAADGSILGGPKLEPGRWHELRFEWSGLLDGRMGSCRLILDGVQRSQPLALNRPTVNGISYVQFISGASREDRIGFLIESVSAEVR